MFVSLQFFSDEHKLGRHSLLCIPKKFLFFKKCATDLNSKLTIFYVKISQIKLCWKNLQRRYSFFRRKFLFERQMFFFDLLCTDEKSNVNWNRLLTFFEKSNFSLSHFLLFFLSRKKSRFQKNCGWLWDYGSLSNTHGQRHKDSLYCSASVVFNRGSAELLDFANSLLPLWKYD